MAFKLPGKSIHKGTDAHRAAVKATTDRATSWWKGEEGFIPDELQGGDKRIVKDGKLVTNPETQNRETSYLAGEEGLIPDELQGGDKATVIDGRVVPKETDQQTDKSTENKSSKSKLAYGGTKTWGQAQKEGEESGFDLNQTTKDQRAYEREMKAQNPDWNKREDNEWKRRQNSINAALGSKKVYEVESDEVVDLQKEKRESDAEIVKEGEENPTMNIIQNEEGEDVYGAALDVGTKTHENELKYQKQLKKQRVKDAREKFGRGSDEVKAAKAKGREDVHKARVMKKTNKRDQKFVDRDEKLQIRIDKRKEAGKDTTRLEEKQRKNKEKQQDWDESGYNKYYRRKMKKYL